MILNRSGGAHGRRAERIARRSVGVLLAVSAGVPLVACGASPSSSHDATTIEAAARNYTEAVLHGTARDLNDSLSATCANRATDAGLTALRNFTSAHSGTAVTSLHVVSIETRNLTATTGEAWVHVDLSPDLEGNDNWLTYAIEDGRWKLTDCGRLPFGGSSSSGPSTVIGATGAGPTPTK